MKATALSQHAIHGPTTESGLAGPQSQLHVSDKSSKFHSSGRPHIGGRSYQQRRTRPSGDGGSNLHNSYATIASMRASGGNLLPNLDHPSQAREPLILSDDD